MNLIKEAFNKYKNDKNLNIFGTQLDGEHISPKATDTSFIP